MRVVLDTNCLVSSLIFPKGITSCLRIFWQSEKIIPLVCEQTVRELILVFAYPKFQLSQPEIKDLLNEFLPFAEIMKLKNQDAVVDGLRDPNDAIFIQLMRESNANYLVSGDKDILVFGESHPQENIISPANFIELLNKDIR